MTKVYEVRDHWQITANSSQEALDKMRNNDIDCYSHRTIIVLEDEA